MHVLLSTSIDKSVEPRYNAIYSAIQAIAQSRAAISDPPKSVFSFSLTETDFNNLQREILHIYKNVDYSTKDTFIFFIPYAPEEQEIYSLEPADDNQQQCLIWKTYSLDNYIKSTKEASKQ